MGKQLLLSALFLMIVQFGFGQIRQQQKLYPRTAFEKYEPAANEPEVQFVSILIKGLGHRDFKVTIKELKIKGTTNKHGSYVYKLPKSYDHDKSVTVRVEADPEGAYADTYKPLVLKMTIKQLVNRTHEVELEKKSSSKITNRHPKGYVTHKNPSF